jgi:polyphosphate kinase
VVTPVTDPDLTRRLQEILEVMLADNLQAWELHEDGSWHRCRPGEGERRLATQKRLQDLALRRGVEARSAAKRDQDDARR